MVTQTVLPFRLAVTDESMTPHAGLVLFGEYVHSLALPRLIDNALPEPGSSNGYNTSEFKAIYNQYYIYFHLRIGT